MKMAEKTVFIWAFIVLLSFGGFSGFAYGSQKEDNTAGRESADDLSSSGKETSDPDSGIGLFGLPLEEAYELEVICSASLTEASKRLTPAAVTTITREQIDRSAARSLDELLEIYVPGFQILTKDTANLIGIRGIISDRNNKFLLLVNGINMNNLTSGDISSERFLSLLGDIERIDVVRGSGSAIYGPGAIAGVISIRTYNSRTFEGTDVQVRQGAVEEFSNIEIRHGQQFTDDRGLFLYYGIDNYRGADQDDSKVFFSKSFTAGNGQQVRANKSVPFDVVDNYRSYRNRVRQKFYGQYNHGDVDYYVRYTRGGIKSLQSPIVYENFDPEGLLDSGFGYQQLSAGVSYDQNVNKEFRVNYRFNVDVFDLERFFTYREDKYYTRVLSFWEPVEEHKTALGFEYAQHRLGKRSPGFPNEPATLDNNIPSEDIPWNTERYAILGEYQWQFSDAWTAFLGGRLDDHTYTDWLFSPRTAVVYAPGKQDTYKFIYNRSVRRSDEADMYKKFLESGDTSDNDKIDTLEFRFERQQSKSTWFAFSGYYSDYEIVAFSGNTQDIQPIGNLKFYGLEIEGTYKTDKTRVTFSHNFTQQLDFELEDPSTTIQNVSAEPYGFGDDLANWSDHETKVTAEYDFDPKWTASGSVRCFWGYPGAEDMADYNKEELGGALTLPVTDGSDEAFAARAYMNLGLEYRPSDRSTWRLDAYNVLGWLDRDINRRSVFFRTTTYRQEAAAIALTYRYKF